MRGLRIRCDSSDRTRRPPGCVRLPACTIARSSLAPVSVPMFLTGRPVRRAGGRRCHRRAGRPRQRREGLGQGGVARRQPARPGLRRRRQPLCGVADPFAEDDAGRQRKERRLDQVQVPRPSQGSLHPVGGAAPGSGAEPGELAAGQHGQRHDEPERAAAGEIQLGAPGDEQPGQVLMGGDRRTGLEAALVAHRPEGGPHAGGHIAVGQPRRVHRAARCLPRQPLEHPSNRVTASVNPRDQGPP